MAKLIDGRALAEKMYQDLTQEVRLLGARGVIAKLGIILVGDHRASLLYIKQKQEAAQKYGIGITLNHFDEKITETELIANLEKIQTKSNDSGLIIQLPLPAHLSTDRALDALRPSLDVDCLTSANLGKLLVNTPYFWPPTVAGIMTILSSLKIKLKGARVAVVGTGRLIGKPLVVALMNAEATVFACNDQTSDLKAHCLAADIIISAAGVPNLIRGEMVKNGAIVIDAGTTIVHNKIQGDVDFDLVSAKAKFLTPTPGGVGPLTVAHLLRNTVLAAKILYP